MTDSTHSPLPDLPDEELASSYVDGELTEEVRRVVESDPRLMAIVSAHGVVHDAVGGPVAVLSDAERERLVATALAALTPVAPVAPIAPHAPQDDGRVVELAAARTARSRRLVQVAAGGLAAVAAVGVLALVITRNDSPGTGETGGQLAQTADSAPKPAVTAAAADSGSGSGGSTEDQSGRSAASVPAAAVPAAEAPASAAPETTAAASEALIGGLVDLGPLANRTELIAAARPFATASPPDGPRICGEPLLGTATFQGAPAYLVVIEASAAGNRVALVDAATCAVLVKVDLAEP